MAYGVPMAEDDFWQTLADLFDRLGFEADRVSMGDGCEGDLVVRYPSRIRHAIAVIGAVGPYPVGASSIQRVLALMRRCGAGEGWAVTDASFAPDARELAALNGVRLIEGVGLSGLLTQAATDRGREAAVDALLAHSGFYDGENPLGVGGGTAGAPEAVPREPSVQPTVRMPRQQAVYDYVAPAASDAGYGAAPQGDAPVSQPLREAPRGRSSGCRAGCVTALVIILVLALFLVGTLLALPTVLDQLPLSEGLAAVKEHALAFFGKLEDAVISRLGSFAG